MKPFRGFVEDRIRVDGRTVKLCITPYNLSVINRCEINMIYFHDRKTFNPSATRIYISKNQLTMEC